MGFGNDYTFRFLLTTGFVVFARTLDDVFSGQHATKLYHLVREHWMREFAAQRPSVYKGGNAWAFSDVVFETKLNCCARCKVFRCPAEGCVGPWFTFALIGTVSRVAIPFLWAISASLHC